MILYLTTDKNFKLIDEVCEELGIVVEKSKECENLQQYVAKKLSNGGNCDAIIIDLKTLKSDNQTIMAGIDCIRRFQNCKIIIIAKGYANNDEIIFALKSKNCDLIIVEDENQYICSELKDFLLGKFKNSDELVTRHTEVKEEQMEKPKKVIKGQINFNDVPVYQSKQEYINEHYAMKVESENISVKNINDENQINQMYVPPLSPSKQQQYTELPQPPKQISPPVDAPFIKASPKNGFTFTTAEPIADKKIKHKIIITIFGSEKRIGTTTQALQIAYYLKYLGYKCCYVQADGTDKIQKIAKFYNISTNKDIGLIQFNGIDIYYKFDLAYITSLAYDCFVFDYGIFGEEHIQTALLSDFKIMVCGSKAWEEENLVEVFKKSNRIVEMYFLFSFTEIDSQMQIKYLMGGHSNRTYFSNYTPNPFINNGENFSAYENIFKNIEQENVNVVVPKKKGFMSKIFR